MITTFKANIKNPNQSVIMDLSYPNRPLLIVFGGIGGGLGGKPPFEFFNLTKNLDVNKIYLRDPSKTWYHAGFPGISHTIGESACFLKQKIDESCTDKVVVVGNSMGGYAAILFGILIKADIIHAFVPQTFLADSKLIRNEKQIHYVHNNFSNKYFDLYELMKLHNDIGPLNIYYDSKNKLDTKHAMHLKNLQNITLHAFSGGGHTLIKELRDSGELQDIIVSSLSGKPNKLINSNTKKQRSFLTKFFGSVMKIVRGK